MTRRLLAAAIGFVAIAVAARAQPASLRAAPAPTQAAPTAPAPQQGAQRASAAPQNAPNKIIAEVDGYIITFDDVYRQVSPLMPSIQAQAKNPKDYEDKLDEIYNGVVNDLIDQRLLINYFKKPKEGQKDAPKVPASFVKGVIEEQINDDFDGDRSKYYAYLQANGKTPADYAKDTEEKIIVQFMRGQQRKSQSVVSPVKIQQFYDENKERFFEPDAVRFKLLQYSRDGQTDEQLLAKAQEIMAKFKAGTKFEDLVKEYSSDSHKATGGDYPMQTRPQMLKEFGDPIFEAKPPGGLEKGDVTDPIIRPEGLFLLYVEERVHAGVQPIDKVRDEIEQTLAQQMGQVDSDRLLERLRRNAFIKIYP